MWSHDQHDSTADQAEELELYSESLEKTLRVLRYIISFEFQKVYQGHQYGKAQQKDKLKMNLVRLNLKIEKEEESIRKIGSIQSFVQ